MECVSDDAVVIKSLVETAMLDAVRKAFPEVCFEVEADILRKLGGEGLIL